MVFVVYRPFRAPEEKHINVFLRHRPIGGDVFCSEKRRVQNRRGFCPGSMHPGAGQEGLYVGDLIPCGFGRGAVIVLFPGSLVKPLLGQLAPAAYLFQALPQFRVFCPGYDVSERFQLPVYSGQGVGNHGFFIHSHHLFFCI